LVQFMVWLTEGSGVMRRDRKEWCCDAKQALPGSLRGTETGERVGCCEVKSLQNMWVFPQGNSKLQSSGM